MRLAEKALVQDIEVQRRGVCAALLVETFPRFSGFRENFSFFDEVRG